MANDPQQTQTAQAPKEKEAPAAKQDVHTATVYQPRTPAEAKYLDSNRQVAINTVNGVRVLPAEVSDALLPMPVLQNVKQPDMSVFGAMNLPSGHTYDGGVGLGINYSPVINPADAAIAQFTQGIDSGSNGHKQMTEQFAIYCKGLTSGLGDSWQKFQQEMQNSHDPNKLGWDDAQQQNRDVVVDRTALSQASLQEFDQIAAVQERQKQMTELIGELATLNTELEKKQVERELESTQASLTATDSAAKTQEAGAISTIDSVITLGLSVAGATTTPAAALEVAKATSKPIAAFLHKHIFKSDELERLQNEVKRLSIHRDRLKGHKHLLEDKIIKDKIESVGVQMNQLNGSLLSTYEAIESSMQNSNSVVSTLAQDANQAAGALQTCGKKTKTCETPEGDYQSMTIFSKVREEVTAAIPQLIISTQTYQAAHDQYQIPTKARKAADYAQEHGPKFVPKDPALAPEYAQLRASSSRAVQQFQYWANLAEAEMHNAREIASHVQEFKGQKAMLHMQNRLGSEMTSEANKTLKR